MGVSVEVLITGEETTLGAAAVKAALNGAIKAGLNAFPSKRYTGKGDWLCLFGPGQVMRNAARIAQVRKGGHAACFDLGYFAKAKEKQYVRVSVDHNHPQKYIPKTPNDPGRFEEWGITLRNDYDPDGPIIVAGLGQKSRVHLTLNDWEIKTLNATQRRFPGKKVIYRPKPQGMRDPHINWEPRDGFTPIEDLLKGASLVVCRHSNVAVDACIAGIPVETEDGAAHALYHKLPNPSAEKRLDFLRRLCYWQWNLNEMEEMWKFLTTVVDK